MSKLSEKNWFWGTFFIVSALFVILSQVQTFADITPFTVFITIVLAALLVSSLMHRNFVGIFVPLAFLYDLYQKPLKFPLLSIWLLLAAALLLSAGLHILFGRRAHPFSYASKRASRPDTSRFETPDNSADDDNHPYAKVSFGAASRYLHGDALESGCFETSFGALELYFDQARLAPGGAVIRLGCSFGAIKLFVPRGWRVIDQMEASFGGVDNGFSARTAAPDAPVLTLTGSVSLGGVEIHPV